MNLKKALGIIINNCYFYVMFLFLCSVAVAIYDIRPAVLIFVINTALLSANIALNAVRKNSVKKFVETLKDGMNEEEKHIIGDTLIPITIINNNGIIVWSNKSFDDISHKNKLIGTHINEVFPEFDIKKYISLDTNTSPKKLTSNDKTYSIKITESKKSNSSAIGNYYAIYFYDRTEIENLQKKYDDDAFVSSVILVDNYEDIMQDISGSDKIKVSTAIEGVLNDFASSVDGVLKQFEKDRYMFYFSKSGLNSFIQNKFDILNKIKEISVGNKFPPTISMGIGYGGSSMAQDDAFSYSALDMALGRGGDQAIIKNSEKYLFFGGKSKETEKRTRVKSRVFAFAIKQLVADYDSILIMGHKHADTDAFGAAIGLYRIIKYLGKSPKIVMETYNKTVERLLDRFDDPEYQNVIIDKASANEIVDENTLIFVVDTHMYSMVEEPALLDVSKNIVIIDHHRKTADFIQNNLLSYHEAYASSSSELVTEIVQYIGDDLHLKKNEAEALYAGMYLDTKNFTFKTGVRTFEAASQLKRLGVETISVKKLFQIDMNTFTKKWSIIEKSMTYRHCFSIAACTKNDDDMQTIVAQVADELLNITDITCSFVVCDMGGKVIISARSLGDYNVQLIMENLGGGGNLTSAAAQLPGINTQTAVEKLKSAIDEYININGRKE